MLLKSKYFQEKELICRCGCGLLNYDDLFLMKLNVFRDLVKIPLIVTSGCRCIKHNKNVGGQPTSLHIGEGKKATAIDVTDFNANNFEKIFQFAKKTGFFNEVMWYKKLFFIHLGIDSIQKGNYHVIV